MNVLVIGAGRMGKMVASILTARGHRVGAVVGSRGDQSGRSLANVLDSEAWDGAWEFTLPGSALSVVEPLLQANIPTISGTTGWEVDSAVNLANDLRTSFLHAPNFSIGVAVTRRLVAAAAEWFRPFDEFQPAVFERHHRMKQDRPSGTAKMLSHAIGGPNAIEIASVRQGAVPGEHMVFFDGESESVEITHRARSREIFAHGAVLAGEWLMREPPNRSVTFEDFLDFERTWPWKPTGVESTQHS